MLKTTKQHQEYWRDRKIDWDIHYTQTWNHPHRKLITWVLRSFPWVSLWEVGCGSAPNLIRIIKEGFQGKQLGGSDINADAIEQARKTFREGRFHVESSEDMLLSDRAVDVMLSDAHLIYVGPFKIKNVLAEMVRIGRNYLVLCEYNEKSLWKRIWLWWKTGYFAHDYKRLLTELGCYDIRILPIPEEYWGGNWSKYGAIIICRLTHI